MRVVDHEALQLAVALHQHAGGARRQGGDRRAVGDLLGEQGAMRGAVEQTQGALGVQGEEALAALLGEDLGHRAVAQLEVADAGQRGATFRIAHHEPLGDAALGVADHQRDAAEQRGGRGDGGGAVAGQVVATVQAVAAQVEHVGGGAAVEGVQPLLARVDDQRVDRVGDLRQGDALLAEAGLAGEQVLLALEAEQVQLAAGGGGQQQGRAVEADADLVQRAALRIENQRRRAEGIGDLGDDGLDVVGVGHLVVVLQQQRLAIGQAQHHAAAARLVLGDRDDLAVGRQGHADAVQRGAALEVEELHLATAVEAHGHLVLLLDGQQQRLLLLRQPGRLLRLARFQLGAAEQRHDHAGQVEEDQGDGAENGETANRHVPACQAVLECAHAPLALQRRRIEIQSLRFQGGSHGFVGQVIHAHTLTVIYDTKITGW